MKWFSQQAFLIISLSSSIARAWKLQEYHSSGCQDLLQTEGGTEWKRCTNFKLPKDDNMARGIKYSGSTPVPGGERWLFDLRVFKGKDCSGEEVFVTGALAEKCIAGPWKSFMVNRYVPISNDRAGTKDKSILSTTSPGNDQDAETKRIPNDQNPMFPDDTRDVLDGGLLALIEEDDVSVNDITNLPTKTYCKDEKTNKGRDFLKEEIRKAIQTAEECKGKNPNPCKDKDPAKAYPHVYNESKTTEFWTFPIKLDGIPYLNGQPGPFRVAYKRKANGDQAYSNMYKHKGTNDLSPC